MIVLLKTFLNYFLIGMQGVQGLKGLKGELGLPGPEGQPGLQGITTLFHILNESIHLTFYLYNIVMIK